MKRGIVILSAFKIARKYWFSEEKWSAWGLLLAVIALNLGLVYLTVLINYWQGSFYGLIQDYNQAAFLEALGKFGLLSLLFVIGRGYQTYTRMQLHIRWRRWLTGNFLRNWMSCQTYYRIQLFASHAADNPDQRISEDVDLFVSYTLRLSIDLLQDLASMCSFIFILWELSGVVFLSLGPVQIPVYGYLVWVALAYAGFGTYVTVRLGWPLIQLEYNQQKYEADFRFALIRIRENAESIALYCGEKQERRALSGWFNHIVANYLRIIQVRKQLTLLTAAYTRSSVVFALFAASPRYFSRQIHLGQMFQIVDAYQHVQNGLSFIIDSFTWVARWRAVVNRLNSFLVCMEMVRAEAKNTKLAVTSHQRAVFEAERLSVLRPDGYKLIHELAFSAGRGERLLVAGPSGCGKSTLLRALAGIWPYTEGTIRLPDRDTVMYVPQKSYMPIDQLRHVLHYPQAAGDRNETKLLALLDACRLGHLGDKLGLIADWGQTLSLGEQQRIAFIRVLLTEPGWLFLDEATSALDEPTEQAMYELVARFLPRTAVVSVGHRRTLQQFHSRRLELDGRGGWKLAKG